MQQIANFPQSCPVKWNAVRDQPNNSAKVARSLAPPDQPRRALCRFQLLFPTIAVARTLGPLVAEALYPMDLLPNRLRSIPRRERDRLSGEPVRLEDKGDAISHNPT